MMSKSLLLDPVQILYGSNQSVIEDAVLITDGIIKSFGQEARDQGSCIGLVPQKASRMVFAPCLVDPHSILQDPITGYPETLSSLRKAAAHAGYGQLALLPRGSLWRDQAEMLQGFSNPLSDVLIHLWGSFSCKSKGEKLAPHASLIQNGAIGIAEDEVIPPINLLKQGLIINQFGSSPILLAPRDSQIQGNGIVREGVETLRSGFPPDPLASELIPLSLLLELCKQHPDNSIRLMNISTAAGAKMLEKAKPTPMSSVCWWHLITDRTTLSPLDIGWRVSPSLGSGEDRNALIKGLLKGIISAVSVHATPLDDEEIKSPLNEQLAGVSGHHLVLPCLWQELVVKSGFTIEQLWEAISFGPSKMLKADEECLRIGSRRWLLFNPDEYWIQDREDKYCPLAANQPFQGQKMLGRVIACGLRNIDNQND